MAMFGMKKTKPSEGSELVLAYLEDAQRVRATLLLVDQRGREVPATFVSVMDDKVIVAPQGSLTVDKGGEVNLLFIQEGLRFKAPTRLLEAKPGSASLEVPSSIALAERRKKPRARINPREGATVTVLTGLFDGVGMNGTIENISESGICVRVDRAMDVKTQRKMHMGANMLQVGQPLMLIKMVKLPKCPTLELGGTVAWLDASQGVLLGIAFEPGTEGMLGSVRSLVASRAGAIPTSVPPKARRQSEAAREEEQEKYTPKPTAKKEPDPAPKVEVEPVAEVAPPPPEPPPLPSPVAPPEPVSAPEPSPVDDRSQALLRVK